MDTQHEIEGNVYWQIEYQGMTVIITVGTIDREKMKVIVYKCEYPPIFGYDKYDISRIDEILDKWITKFQG